MMRVTTPMKLVMVIVAAALFLTFSRLTLVLLVPALVGVLLVSFGIIVRYKPASVLGLFVCLAVVAIATEIDTLTETSVWLTSVFGILVPTCLLTWSCLLAENEDAYPLRLKTGAFMVALGSLTAVAAAVPVVAVSVGVALPAVSSTLSTLAQASMVFLIIAAMSLMALRSPSDGPMDVHSEK